MALNLVVVPAKVFATGEKVTTAKLNQLGAPTIQVLDDNLVIVVADGSVNVDKLADGALTANATGLAKMENGFLTLEKLAEEARTGVVYYGAGTLAAGVYSVDLDPAVTAYAAGMRVLFKADAANEGAVDLNLNAIVTSPNLLRGDRELQAGDILAGDMVEAVFDGTSFQVISQNRAEFVGGDYQLAFGVVGQGGVSGATAGLVVNVAHGLGGVPREVRWVLKCNDAGGDAGYAQNEEIDAGTVMLKRVITDEPDRWEPTWVLGASATNVFMSAHEDMDYSSGARELTVVNKGTGVVETLTRSKWVVKVYARR